MDEISQLESDLELGQALSRLEKNRDFKRLISKMYLEDGAIMLTKNYCTIKHRDSGKMMIIEDELAARSLLMKFLSDIKENANGAGMVLKEMQEEANAEASDGYIDMEAE